jgi:hypothetical protein
MQPLTPEVYVPRHLSLRTDKAYTRWLRGNAAGGFGCGRVDGWEVSQQCLWTTHESNWKEVHAVESTFKGGVGNRGRRGLLHSCRPTRSNRV